MKFPIKTWRLQNNNLNTKLMKTLIILALSFIVGYSFTGCGEKKTEEQTTPQNNTQSGTNTPLTEGTPPKIALIWKNVDLKLTALEKVINSGNYQHLHESREIVTLLESLPSRSKSLGNEKLQSLNKVLSELSKLSLQIDELSHNNRKSEVPDVFASFKKQVSEIKNLYPEESFKE
jgi:hypothetical protein